MSDGDNMTMHQHHHDMSDMSDNESVVAEDDHSTAPLLPVAMDPVDCSVLLLVLQVLQTEMSRLKVQLLLLIQQLNKLEVVEQRPKPCQVQRRSFQQIANLLSPSQFRRMFRMIQQSFWDLCEQIKAKVGESVFKSHDWLISEDARTSMAAARQATGGILPGEIKLAMAIRLLAGASYLDVLAIYGVCSASVYSAFHEAINWICLTFRFPLAGWIQTRDEAALDRVAEGFAAASGGVFQKCIGALDGLAVKIKSPTLSQLIPDPGNYFCRKGFYALNVQAICDKQRRVIWVSTGHKGSTHDSTAFNETQLAKDLETSVDWLERKGYFLVGDSAYPLFPYLLVPYSNPEPQSAEDAYNFWLSNSRIQIECTFGEIVMRFGIFWRKMLFNLQQVGKIIHGAMLLHNFLIDEREIRVGGHEEDALYFRTFSLQEQDDRRHESSEQPSAVATDNNEPHPGGRPSGTVADNQERGIVVRDGVCSALYGNQRARPMQSNMSYNSHGQIYFNA